MADDGRQIKHTTAITLSDGSSVTHTAEAVRYKQLSDGAIAVFAYCCGLESEGSWHTIYDLAKMPQPDLLKEVSEHVKRKAAHHASVHLAKDFMGSLLKEGGSAK